MLHKRLLSFVVFLSLLIASSSLHAQDLLKGKDLSTVRVDQLSDADIAKLKAQLGSSGMTIDQAEQMAIAKGMSPAEFAKLKERLNSGTTNTATGKLRSADAEGRIQGGEPDSTRPAERPGTLIDSLIFGSELYTSMAPSFTPNLNLATPVNYVLGPGDQLQVTVYGVQEYNGEHTITPDGFITIPNVGQVRLNGLTIEAATDKLKSVMGNSVYGFLKSGGSKLSVTLTKIRTIRITIIGANKPGNFNVSSLSTVFNALYLAGGPNGYGSFRQIELIRNNKVIDTVDLYRFLLHGDQRDNIGLKENDVIRIPPYKTRVQILGQVKRPGIFEILPGESFADALRFAAGFTDTAYRASVKVYQHNDKERAVQDLAADAYGQYHPQTGDHFVVSKILNRFANRVRISGAVFRPDVYALSPGLTVGELIRRADGLREDAYTGRGQIIRLEDDLTRSLISFDVRKALNGDAANNPVLKREDEVLISSIQELKDSMKISIQGEIRIPGIYDYVDKLTLKDLILQAGGFTDAAFKNIEIARLISRDSLGATDNRAATIIHTSINGDEGLQSGGASILLQPYDVVTIRRKAGYAQPQSVMVSGQVQYPGPYALSSSNERVSDLLKRAGGFTPNAYPAGAYLKRYKTAQEKAKAEEAAKKLQKTVKDTAAATLYKLQSEITRDYDQIPLDLPRIQRAPGSTEDLTLRANDELYIPVFDSEVKISGSVLSATQIPYSKEKSLKDYLDEAGGFSADAWRKKVYVVYPNGQAATTTHFLFFKSYPKVMPGSELVVPKRPEKKGTSAAEAIGMASALASLAGVVIALLKL